MTKKEIETYVLDDNHDDRVLIEEILKEEQIWPHSLFANSHDMFIKWHNDVYLLILDYTLVGDRMTAMEIMKKARELNSDLYVIIVTGIIDPEVIMGFLKAKADDYIDKGGGVLGGTGYLKRLRTAVKDGRKCVQDRIEKNEKQKRRIAELESLAKRGDEWIKNRKSNVD